MSDDTRQAGESRGARWFLVLFGMPFAAVGIGLLGWKVMPEVMEWRAMQSWEPVSAEVIAADLRAHTSDGSTTWEATGRYRYEYAGSEYTGDRVAISAGADNIGDFQQRVGAELSAALSRGEPVTVYVDPWVPSSAVYNRELRTGLVALMGVFALVFAGVGLGLMAWGLFARGPATGVVDSERPWLENRDWASPRIASNAKGGARFAWLFAILWCAICVPVSFVIPGELAKGNWPVLLILLFDLIGIGLVAWAVRATLSARRFGDMPLEMDPHPGAIGGDVGGFVDIPVAHDPAQLFRVSLACTRTYTSGSGKNRSTHHEVKWQDERWLQAEPLADGQVRLWFRFEPPAGLPVSEPASGDYHAWHLDLAADLPGIDLARRYTLPVFATGARASRTVAPRVRESNAPHLAAIEALTRLEQVPGGAAMDFRAGRNLVGGLMVFGIGGLGFGGGGVALLASGAALVAKLFIGGIFVLIGGACLAGGLWLMGNRLRVEATDDGVHIRRWLFGMPVHAVQIPRAQIEGVGIAKGATMTSSSGTTVFYDLVLRAGAGAQHGIGDGFRGVSQARQAAETFGLYARLPYLGEQDPRTAFLARKAARLAARRGRD